MNRDATWPAEKGGHKQGLHGQRKRAETTSDRPARQMNRNVASPAEKGGHQQ